jgi:hypothetical protein
MRSRQHGVVEEVGSESKKKLLRYRIRAHDYPGRR